MATADLPIEKVREMIASCRTLEKNAVGLAQLADANEVPLLVAVQEAATGAAKGLEQMLAAIRIGAIDGQIKVLEQQKAALEATRNGK